MNANKDKIGAEQAWELLKDASLIHVAKGKKHMAWDPSTDDRQAIMKLVIGPSGNLRAPTWRIADEFLIGFNPDQYQELLSG